VGVAHKSLMTGAPWIEVKPTLWDTGSTYLPSRVWGYGTGVNLVVWAGAVPVLFDTPVLPQLFLFVAPVPPFF